MAKAETSIMTDRNTSDPANPFDATNGYSGQDYHLDREQAEGRRHPAGEVDPKADRAPAPNAPNDPPEAGRRAFFDPATGEVHGSGSGAGGGTEGEDYDSDSAGGSDAGPAT
ncbi:hypothetical protein DMC47_15960 [Nostoc sp. 3335mG]|nr:hypothetical protein DMC47_15960 [Nostoc sp. 3335mG]